MAARRGRSQARRSGGGNNGLPGWAWLVIGVLLALGAVLLAPKFMGAKDGTGGFFRMGAPHADPDAQPRGSSETDGAFEPVGAAPATAPKKTAEPSDKAGSFDFYELLPGEEVAMTDAQIAAIAREEARRKAAEEARAQAALSDSGLDAATQAADAQERAAAAAAGLPQALPETRPAPARPVQVASAQPAPTPASTPVAATPSPATTPVAESRPPTAATPYVLQAGAFQASADAEAVKAKVALLGLNARVESANINGKTMYRVRMGPYATASELAEAKGKLASGGLPAVAVKAK